MTVFNYCRRLAVVTLVGLLPSTAMAGAAYIYEMSSVSEPGYGGAGMVARANDAGTVFSNPAGMTRFDESEILAGGAFTYISSRFNPDENNTVEISNNGVGVPIPAGSAAYIHPLSDRLKLGISMQNYFGLALNWNDQWAGRYSAVSVALLAPQLQSTVAYEVNDWLSVGAGAALTLGYLSDKMRVDPEEPGRADGKLTLSDADFAVQGNFGVMIEPTASTRIGIRYLTETDLDFKDAPDVSGLLIPNPNTKNVDLGLKMPQSLMAAIHHQWNDELALLGSVGWDEWSAFSRIKVGLRDGDIETRLDADFRDTWHFGVGAEYQYEPKLMLTGGISFDTSMSSDRTRPIVLPLGAMYRYGVGFKYRASDSLTYGGGFTWLWQGNLPIKETSGVSGHYHKTSITFLSFYAMWH